MSRRTRRNHSAVFKANVAVESPWTSSPDHQTQNSDTPRNTFKLVIYGAVDCDLAMNAVTPMAKPTAPVSSDEEEARAEIETSLQPLVK